MADPTGVPAGGAVAVRLTQATARRWVDRWDEQQQAYLPDREDRFTAMIDAVQEIAARPDPLVLDLGCGPGSLSVRLLDQIPAARVVAIDADPLLLALGRTAWSDRLAHAGGPGIRFAEQDLRAPGWSGALDLARSADAAVSTTALHWLSPEALAAMYAEVANALRPGGLMLNGDHLSEDPDTAPTLARLGRALVGRAERRRPAPAGAETWTGWWEAARSDPDLADLATARERICLESGHHGSPSGRLAVHVEALRAAGFAEVGTLWQRGDDRLLCAVMPG